jgi:hypothetical protein
MRILETDPNGNLRESNTKRVRYTKDDKGKVVEEYEESTYYGVVVAGNVFAHYKEREDKARELVRNKKSSPIEYFMYKTCIELELLVALTGFSRREVKKHMKPHVFEKLDDDVLRRYAEVFETDINTIKSFNGY